MTNCAAGLRRIGAPSGATSSCRKLRAFAGSPSRRVHMARSSVTSPGTCVPFDPAGALAADAGVAWLACRACSACISASSLSASRTSLGSRDLNPQATLARAAVYSSSRVRAGLGGVAAKMSTSSRVVMWAYAAALKRHRSGGPALVPVFAAPAAAAAVIAPSRDHSRSRKPFSPRSRLCRLSSPMGSASSSITLRGFISARVVSMASRRRGASEVPPCSRSRCAACSSCSHPPTTSGGRAPMATRPRSHRASAMHTATSEAMARPARPRIASSPTWSTTSSSPASWSRLSTPGTKRSGTSCTSPSASAPSLRPRA
mmetsp:Transcript_2524/g.10059  ORF Transcript_2524/g.10059 Transcript_2524/m.10059 type:complete len:316 (-) Transcript_2524:306-1253(-)